jgi:hypothetical protein
LSPRQSLDFTPQKIKVDLFIYNFNKKLQDINRGKFWTKKFNKLFIPAIEKGHLGEVFSTYGIPSLTTPRDIKFSPFALLPILDIVFLIMMIYIAFRIRI